jgi:tetratricopeptide (TPR) repeat protein
VPHPIQLRVTGPYRSPMVSAVQVCKPLRGGAPAPATVDRAAGPGDEVELTGLVKKPELNGLRGTVGPRSEWTGDRVTVRVDTRPPQQLSLRPANVVVVTRSKVSDGGADRCIICLDAGDAQLIQSGCACRGPAGLAHVACRAEAATHSGGAVQWYQCTTCNREFTGDMQHGLAEVHWNRVKGNPTHIEWLEAAADYGHGLIMRGMCREAEVLLRQALDGSTRRLGSHHPDTLLARTRLALALSRQGKYADAETEYRKSISAQTGSDKDATIVNLAQTLSVQGKHAEAVVLFRPAFERQTQDLGAEHTHTMATSANFAHSLMSLGHHVEAAALRDNLLRMRTRVLGAKHPSTVLTTSNNVTSLMDQEKYAEAETAYREVLPQMEEAFGVDHADTVGTRRSLALALSEQDKDVEAEVLCKDVVVTLKRILGVTHPRTIESSCELARVLVKLRKLTEAKALCRAVLPRVMDILGEGSTYCKYVKRVLAM